jgi:NTP pyrophosphatase (non-canonical NTP hydrolase)
MEIQEYQTIIGKTAVYPQDIGLAYCGLGLTGEAGEVAEKIKKVYRDNEELSGYFSGHIPRRRVKSELLKFQKDIKKELGDVLWYITAISNEVGLSFEEIMETNYNKLLARRDTNTLPRS